MCRCVPDFVRVRHSGDVSRFELSVTDPSTGQGRIRLGDFEEAIQVDVEGAPLEWYLGQWRFSLSRLVEDQVEAVIVVCVPAQSSGHPSTGSVPIEAPGEDWEPVEGCGEAWTFTVGDDGRVHVHNVLLFPDLTIIDGFQVVRLEPDDDEPSDDDDPEHVPSEWVIDLVDVAEFVARARGEPV